MNVPRLNGNCGIWPLWGAKEARESVFETALAKA